MNLKDLQERLPWTVKYSRDFRANPQKHKDFAHAITHAMKALGKLSTIVDDMDHRRYGEFWPANYIADLVICALRMANTFPGNEPIDLERWVIDRINSKNDTNVRIPTITVEIPISSDKPVTNFSTGGKSDETK